MRDEIIEAMANAFWVSSYADWWENEGTLDDPHACSGEDWMDCSLDIPDTAYVLAHKFCETIEESYDLTIEQLYNNTIALPGKHYKDPCFEDFGHYLAMEAMGHGVSWSDDHPDHNLKIPSISSCHVYCIDSVDGRSYEFEFSFNPRGMSFPPAQDNCLNTSLMLQEINDYRRSIHMKDLNTSDWTHNDIFVEYERIKSLNK